MKVVFAIGLIALCLWGASQLPDAPIVCMTPRGLTTSFKFTLIIGAICIFLMGGLKKEENPAKVWAEIGLAALVLFILDYLHIFTPFGDCH